MKNAVLSDVTLNDSCQNRCLGEHIASIIRVSIIGEIRTTLAVSNNRSTLQLLVTANVVPTSFVLFALMMESIHFFETWFLEEPRGLTSQKTVVFF
jgi:hypothetical protein